MEISVNESLFDNIKHNIEEMELDEANYPASFDMEKFKALSSFKARVEYANNTLKKLGSGSSRTVYLIDDQTVLKLAKNKKGIGQNEAEINNYYSAAKGWTDAVAQVYEYDEDNFLWVEMEYARPAKKSDFKNIIGVDFDYFADYIKHYVGSVNRNINFYGSIVKGMPKEVLDILNEDDFVHDVVEFAQNSGLIEGDLGRLSSYGVVGDRLVLIDYGYDLNTIELYRKSRRV